MFNSSFQVTYFKDNSNETDDNQTLKLSQLRQLLVKNLKSPTSAFKPKTSTWYFFAETLVEPHLSEVRLNLAHFT
jgi:hypothetical protein